MKKVWSDIAWEDYAYWQTQDKNWSIRIDQKNRLVFKIEDDAIMIAQCKSHYSEK